MKRRCILPLVLIATALAALSATASAAPMYWGARIDGDVYGQAGDAPWDQGVWNTFEAHTGKKVTVVSMGQPWGSFDAPAFQAARNRGAIPYLQMGIGSSSLAEVVAGGQDEVIRAWAQQAKAWGYPFLFGPWWEMNGDWYPWGQNGDFVAAWRHFHDIVVQEGATNVTWAWVPNRIWSNPVSDPAPYYPGDDYVDWVGMDAYNWGTNPLHPDAWRTANQVYGSTLTALKEIAPGKPICICETASTEFGGSKANWIKDALGTWLPGHTAVKAYVWFNWNVPEFGGRMDWPIESSGGSMQAFRKGIVSNTYRSTLPPLTPLAKVPLP
jgi:Glycosyl hydrolase family 26